ncbi:MAG TPA: glycosyltransferase family 39 protein [Steroidobacteraceae bacterium]|nr:glycosyltransferase family 39 protein [Steroidobacteraceae bacterium]
MGIERGTGRRAGALGWPVWLLLALTWFATMPTRALLDPDEGRYSEIPREMLASGDWITPRFNGLKYFEKPPLQYWATAVAIGVFGLHEWSARLWTVGLAFACLPLVYGWVGRLYGETAALAALAALASSPFFGVVGHLNLLDPAFTFFLTAAVLAFTLAQSAPMHSRGERRWMLIAWAAAALAILSKGIVVGVLAGASLVLYTLIERDGLTWRRLHALAGLALLLLIAAPWFIVVSLRNPSFAGFFFVHEHFARFLTTVHQRVEPWWYFLPLLLIGVLPWVGAFVRAVPRAWGDSPGGARPANAEGAAAFKPLKFLLVFSAVTLVFFSASGSKLAPYVLPLFPLLAALTGASTLDAGRLAKYASRIAAGLIVFVAGGLLIYSARRNSFVPHEALGWALAAAILAILAVLVTLSRTGRLGPVPSVALSAIAAILCWQFLLYEYSVIPPSRSARDLVRIVRPSVGSETPLYSVGQYRETLSPYLARTLTLAGFEGELAFGLAEEPEKRMTTEEFARRWSAAGDGVAFIDPSVWDSWRRRGLPGRVLGADNYTVAVSRL